MAQDDELSRRVRERLVVLLGHETDEQTMFGGRGFLVAGHLAVAASDRGLMVRCDPDATDDLAARPHTAPVVMRGREMRGWLRVSLAALTDDDVLADWVEVGASYAGSLPPRPR